jgi:GPH family glycoside/pentoside/hexuronide:cation symporter
MNGKVDDSSDVNSGEVNPDTPPADDSGKLSFKEKFGYGLGDTASNLYWKLFENFQLIFYTDVFGISAAAAGTMFLVTKLWDAINDPMIGFISDRTRTAWGRFRPYLIWGSIPFAVTGILTFYTPDLSPTGKLIYAYITYTLVFMAYTFVNIPYGALMGVLTPKSIERTSASTFRFILAFAGGIIVAFCTEPLVRFFGGTKTELIDGIETLVAADPQTGWFWTVVCYAILAVVLFTITFLTTKERVVPEQVKNSSIGQDIFDLVRNRPWIVLLFVGLFQILAGWTRGSATGFYFTYFLGSEFGRFIGLGMFAAIVGMFLTRPLTAIFGKKRLMILMNIATALFTAALFFVGKDQVWLVWALHVAGSFVSGPVPVLLWAMYADVADYSEWRFHRRATGLVFSAATFSQKLGGALGGAVPGWMLASYHFQAPVDGVKQVQSETTLEGIVLMMSLIPAAFLLAAAAALLFYNISETFLHQIENELQQRKSKSA